MDTLRASLREAKEMLEEGLLDEMEFKALKACALPLTAAARSSMYLTRVILAGTP